MDIVTHAAAGIVLGSPFMLEKPGVAVCFAVGSVLPDLDAFARLFGKLAFMRQHRTFSHSILGTIICAILIPVLLTGQFLFENSVALALGMASHLVFDWVNLYGLMLFYPFSRKRYCRHYFFFVDIPIFAISVLTLMSTIYALYFKPEQVLFLRIALAYCVTVMLFMTCRIVLYYRGMRMLNMDNVVLIPDAFFPWKFIGVIDHGDTVIPIVINVISGQIKRNEPIAVLDHQYAELLQKQPEYRAMRELMPMYRCIKCLAEDNRLTLECRELAIRNFGGLFGTLELNYNTATNTITNKVFHV